MKKTFVMMAGALVVAGAASAAQAGGNTGISINYSSGGYYAPAPVYVAPPPVVYQPAPVYYGPSFYPHYSPAYRISYWNEGKGYKHKHKGHGHGHGHWR